jgi:hypothetical protein
MKQLINFRFLFCLSGLFVLFSVGSYFFPRPLIGKAASFLTLPVTMIHPGFKTEAGLDGRNVMSLKIHIPEELGVLIRTATPTRDVELGFEVGSVFGIPLVFYPLLFSWPGLPIRYRFKAALLVLPALFVLIAIDVSLAFLVGIEMKFLPLTLKNKMVYYVAQGLNLGGRQFLGILLFAATLAPRLLKKPVYPDGQPLERNDPCPCGSGKKYKNCCMP